MKTTLEIMSECQWRNWCSSLYVWIARLVDTIVLAGVLEKWVFYLKEEYEGDEGNVQGCQSELRAAMGDFNIIDTTNLSCRILYVCVRWESGNMQYHLWH